MRYFLIFTILVNFSACDTKDKVKYVTKSAYDELNSKYHELELKNRLLEQQNIKLNNENKILRQNLERYKNGFKSMYE